MRKLRLQISFRPLKPAHSPKAKPQVGEIPKAKPQVGEIEKL